MKLKKHWKTLIFVAALSSSIPFVVTACASANTASINPSSRDDLAYDVGLTTAPLNSLNYIKNKNTFIVAPALVEGFIKDGPEDDVKNALGLPALNAAFETISVDDLDNYNPPPNNQLGGRFYPLDSNGLTVGVGAPTTDQPTILALNTPGNNSFSIRVRTNEGQSTWSNGDKVIPQDFIDSAQYILDINTGSQLLVDFLNLNIKNAQRLVDAQNNYVKVHKRSYVDPFGRKKTTKNEDGSETTVELPYNVEGSWESQNPNDEKEVAAIKEAAQGLGIYTGDFGPFDAQDLPSDQDQLNDFLTKPTNRYADPRQTWSLTDDSEIKGTKNTYAATKYEIRYEFEKSNPVNYFTFLNAMAQNFLRPVNRRFIESPEVGGIQRFGVDKSTFIWNGPFNPEIMELGPQGFIILTKRKEYYSSSRTLVNVIKIFFQNQETVSASLFADGYIAQTNIPTNFIYNFWADPKTRPLMNKKTGFGTVALQLNLDSETGRSEALKDSDFRNALWFAINRSDVLKLVGLDTSFGVTNWTAFGQAKTSKGVPVEAWFDGVNVKTKDGKEYPIETLPYQDHLAKQFTFENVDRSDNNYNLETARFYLDLYRKKHPDVSEVNLEFIHDSSEQQLNAGVAIQDLVKKAFGNFVKVNIKGYPANVYEQFRTQGRFDLTYFNFDSYGTEFDSYIKTFFFSDGIESANQKTTGFRLNPSGDFTYESYFKQLEQEKTDEVTRERLNISKKRWEKIKEISTPLTNANNTLEDEKDHRERINRFFSFLFTDEEKAAGWTEEEAFALVASFEKIIKDAAPIIPLLEVDTQWEISRLGGVRSTFTFQLQYAYDYNHPPRPGLPTSPKK